MADILNKFTTPIFWIMLVSVVADELLPVFQDGGKPDVGTILKIVVMAFLGAIRAQPAMISPKPEVK